MGVITAIVAGVVVAGAAAAAAHSKKAAADKAAHAQKQAISKQEEILRRNLDPAALNRLAVTMDRERVLSRRKLQEETDPELANLRQYGKEELLKEFQRPSESLNSTKVGNQLFNENISEDPRMTALKDSIIAKAQDDLNKGATLPPEFQAELVRTGLSTGAGAGIGTSANQVGGVTSRLLGSAGIDLERQRTAEAQQLTNTAQNLTSSRASILSSIFPTVKAVEDAKIQRAGAAFQIGDATLPQSGLSGSDAVNLEVARRNAQIAAKGQRGVVNANQAIAAGNANAAYIQAAGSAVSGALGGIGGGAGGAAGITKAAGPTVTGGATIPTYTGLQMQDTGIPGQRTPRQQALYDSINAGYGA